MAEVCDFVKKSIVESVGGVKRMTNVLLIYESFIPSVRLCGFEQLTYLQDQGRLVFDLAEAEKVTDQQCQRADVVWFVRNSTWLSWQIAKQCKKMGKLLVYVLDDDVFQIAPTSQSADYFSQKSVRKRVRWFLEECDIFLSPSRYLLEKYKNKKRRFARIEEPCLEWKEPKKKKGTDKLIIGFAGSVDRSSDVAILLEDALETFLKRHGDRVEIQFMGARIDLVDRYGLTYYPYEDNYEAYQKTFHSLEWDIGLAPMPDSEFHRGKHYNKYIEYAACGCVGIYSNVIPYTYAVEHQVNGLLVENTKEAWLDALEWCLENSNKLVDMKQKISIEAVEKYGIQPVSEQLMEVIPELGTFETSHEGNIQIGCYRKMSRIVRYIEFVERNITKPKNILNRLRR